MNFDVLNLGIKTKDYETENQNRLNLKFFIKKKTGTRSPLIKKNPGPIFN
jgi:hypothetical protein